MDQPDIMVLLTGCNVVLTGFNAWLNQTKATEDRSDREVKNLERDLAVLQMGQELILKRDREFSEHRLKIDSAPDIHMATHARHEMSRFMENLLSFYYQGHFDENLEAQMHRLMHELDRMAERWPRDEGREILEYSRFEFPHIQRFFSENVVPHQKVAEVCPATPRSDERRTVDA